MTLNAAQVQELIVDELRKPAEREWQRLKVWESRRNGNLVKTWMPNGVDDEYRDTMRKARGPWLQYAAEVYAQSISVEAAADPETWERGWVATGMEARQQTLIRDVCENGLSYLLTAPAADGGVFMRHLKAARTYHVLEDPWDDVPQYVLTRVRGGRGLSRDRSKDLHRLFDAEAIYEVRGDLQRPDEVSITPHGGPMPVSIVSAGYTEEAADGTDRAVSPVEIGRAAYLRLVDAGFTLLMVQRYGAFPQKWQTGGTIATDDQGNALIRPSVDSMLHNPDYESRFGAFPAADVDKIVAAVDEQFEQMAAILQIPPHYMLGKVVNLSAEALAASEAGFQRKIATMRRHMGLGITRGLDNAADLLGVQRDPGPRVPLAWEDVATTSLAAGADAALKLISVDADPEQAFRLVPTWSRGEAAAAARYREAELDKAAAEAEAEAAAAGAVVETPPRAATGATVSADQTGPGQSPAQASATPQGAP